MAGIAGIAGFWRRSFFWALPLLWTFALGLWGLSRQHTVWRDEAATWQVAQRPVADIWRMLAQVDAVHGLYYLLMHGVFECFGPGTTALRLPSVLAMSVAAACVAAIGRRLAGRWVGVAAGLAFGLLPAVQFYLQEGRPYALVAMGAGISTLSLVVMLGQGGRSKSWAVYAGSVLVCALLNWLSLLILPAHLLTLAWVKAGRGVWARWAGAAATATAGASPLILFSRTQSDQVSWIPPLTCHMLIGPAIVLAIGGFGALADRRRAGRLSIAAVGLPLLAVPHIGLVGLSLVQPLFLDRYILFSMLGLALLIGALLGAAVDAIGKGAARTWMWFLPAALSLAVVALMPQLSAKRSPASRVDDVLASAKDVGRLKSEGDAVLFVPAARRDTALVSPGHFTGLRDIALARSPSASGTLKGLEASPGRIERAVLAQRRILLVTDAPEVAQPVAAERDDAKMSALRTHFIAVADRQVHGRRVTVYERRP
ncbi:glycosyltransferase family 39 protein [Streptomyces flavofungini]|uniref:glycosyltransferase family 39 protein n=1 Tax=Streptomyces flavofungini TaxID=68200 RepID=UPI0034DF54A1